jgi:hypothetical protein
MKRNLGFVLVFWLVLGLQGCGDDGDGADDQNDTSSGDDGATDEGVDQEEADAYGEAAVDATVPIAAIAAPLSTSLDQAEGDTTPSDEAVQGYVEDAVSGNSVVTDAACVAYDWDRLSGAITFTDCTLELSGLPLNGTVSLTFSFLPAKVALSFTELTVGAVTLTGSLSIERAGSISAPSVVLNADMSIVRKDGATTALVITDGTVSADVDGVEVSGATINATGSLTSENVDAPFSATDVYVKRGDCLPSSGTVAFETDNNLRVTFLDKTPSTGIVLITVTVIRLGQAKDVSEEVQVFAPCS